MRKLVLLLVCLLLLVACQTGEDTGEPQTILDWQPTPGAELAPPEDASLPEPIVAGSTPDLRTPEPTQGLEDGEMPELPPLPDPPNTYISEGNGFRVPFPSSWEIWDSDDESVNAYDSAMGLNVYARTGFKNEEETYESLLEMFLDEEESFLIDPSFVAEEEIAFAGDGSAQSALLTATDADGSEVGFWFFFAEEGPRTYFMSAYGQPSDLEARQTTLKTIAKQMEPAKSQLFGYDRDETLVLLGSDPLAYQLDPARQTGSAASYIGQIYSGLVRLSPEMQLEPDLAESWEISPDGTEYTFKLREGISFQNGKPITASDFQYSWERATDPETDSTTAATYLGDILGVSEKLNGEADTIAGIEVVDDRTLKVTLDEPKPYFLMKLTYPTSFVVDEATVDEDDENWVFEPNASGPYKLVEVREETAFIFERNENYHTPPAIPTVIYLLYRVGSSYSLFEFGEVDIIGVGGNEAKRIRDPEDALHDQWVSTTMMCTHMIMLNNTRPPLDDPDLRRALALAVDKEALNELTSEGLNPIAYGILPPAMPGYSAEAIQERAEAGYDPEAAKAALAASEYASGVPQLILVDSSYGSTDSTFNNAIISDWQDVLGVEVVVEFVDPEDFNQEAREGDGHIVTYGWCADYPDPQNFLDILFHSDSDFNVISYSNPEVDALLEQARAELDPSVRLALYQQIEATLIDDAATIPFSYSVADVLVSPRVQGYVLAPMGAPIIHRLSLEPVGEDE